MEVAVSKTGRKIGVVSAVGTTRQGAIGWVLKVYRWNITLLIERGVFANELWVESR